MSKFTLANAQQICVHENLDDLSSSVAQRICDLAQQAISERGEFHLVLTGGETPRRCYEKLRVLNVDWAKVHVYLGDERCLPEADAARNDKMARDTLLNLVAIPAQNIHFMPAELGAEAATQAYSQALLSAPVFDLTLLGMGEDGHTASLFPDNPARDSRDDVVAVFNSPKPPANRVSLGINRINSSRHKIFLVAGAGKRQALQQIAAGVTLPAASVTNAEWHLDQAALPVGR